MSLQKNKYREEITVQTSMKQWMRQRKSVRSFDGRALSEEDRRSLEQALQALQNPFQVPVCFRLLKAGEHGLSSPVIVGAEEYLAAKVKRQPHFELAYGYSFELACLHALSLGLGTVMLAATLNRPAFERAMDLQPGELLPLASPVGYPAQKRSIRESLMRKGIKADERKPFEKLFFQGDFAHGLTPQKAGVFAEALELLRWAPSAANGQPWRAVLSGNELHFYEAKTMRENALGDVQKVDLGIALANFDLARQEDGISGGFVFDDPGLPAPERTHYIVTFRRQA